MISNNIDEFLTHRFNIRTLVKIGNNNSSQESKTYQLYKGYLCVCVCMFVSK